MYQVGIDDGDEIVFDGEDLHGDSAALVKAIELIKKYGNNTRIIVKSTVAPDLDQEKIITIKCMATDLLCQAGNDINRVRKLLAIYDFADKCQIDIYENENRVYRAIEIEKTRKYNG